MEKKYKIIKTISNDAPCGNINFCSISFVSASKIERLAHMNVFGFKVHNGYNTEEATREDIQKIKEKNDNYDIFTAEMGKIHAWDDVTKVDAIEYKNQKLNDLEQKRRENADKRELVEKQMQNESSKGYVQKRTSEQIKRQSRMLEKLHVKGLISKQEFDKVTEIEASSIIVRTKEELEQIESEIGEASAIDYLDENEPVGLKFGCISIYSPKHISGLEFLCFKIRGVYETMVEVNKRVRRLKELSPSDRIYKFEVGKWCAFTENDFIDQQKLNFELNYCIKCYLDQMQIEKDEFTKRKDSLINMTKAEAKQTAAKNRRERRRAKREKHKGTVTETEETETEPACEASAAVPLTTPVERIYDTSPVDISSVSLGNIEDDAIIQQIASFLDEPALRNKYAANPADLQSQTLSV